MHGAFVRCVRVSGGEGDSEKLSLTDKNPKAILAEAQVCCARQPMITVGIFMLILALFLAWPRAGIGVGWLVDFAFAFSVGSGVELDVTLSWMCVLALSLILLSLVLMLLLLLVLVVSWLIGGSFLTCLFFLSSRCGPACWLDTSDRSATSATKVVHGIWEVYREELDSVPPDLVLALRSAFDRSGVDEFWGVWSVGAEAGLLGVYQRLVPCF